MQKYKSYLELFGLSENFTGKELKEAYRDLAHVWHPDKHNYNNRIREKAVKQIQIINEGHEFLKEVLRTGNTKLSSYSEPDSPNGKNREQENRDSTTTSKRNTHLRKYTRFWKGITFAGIIFLCVIFYIPLNRNVPFSDITNQKKAFLSKALDKNNGFKNFHFNLSISEAEKRQKPDRKIYVKDTAMTDLYYHENAYFTLHGNPMDSVILRFFKKRLYRIDFQFSSNGQDIYQALQNAFGDTFQDDTWSREGRRGLGESWVGENVFCTILGVKQSSGKPDWNHIVMYDIRMNRSAFDYVKNEPVRASEDIMNNGVGDARLGMNLNKFVNIFLSTPHVTNLDFQQKNVSVSKPENIRIGPYKFKKIRGLFFQDKLYRIDFVFSENGDKIYKAFMTKFPQSVRKKSWTRGDEKLISMESSLNDNGVSLLAHGSTKKWNSIVFYNVPLSNKIKNMKKIKKMDRGAGDI